MPNYRMSESSLRLGSVAVIVRFCFYLFARYECHRRTLFANVSIFGDPKWWHTTLTSNNDNDDDDDDANREPACVCCVYDLTIPIDMYGAHKLDSIWLDVNKGYSIY